MTLTKLEKQYRRERHTPIRVENLKLGMEVVGYGSITRIQVSKKSSARRISFDSNTTVIFQDPRWQLYQVTRIAKGNSTR